MSNLTGELRIRMSNNSDSICDVRHLCLFSTSLGAVIRHTEPGADNS